VNLLKRDKAKHTKKFPRQTRLAGLLRGLEVTYEELGRAIGLSGSTISQIVTGTNDYKLSIGRKIKTYLQLKSKREISLDEIMQ
jgi:predicted transcriptional regulator